MSLRWDRHFLDLAAQHARMSKDPSTKVGAVIVGPDREIRSAGFNGFPRGIADTPERLNDRDTKLKLVVHGEMNAILAAARVGVPLKGCTLYTTLAPCSRCAVEIIQAGITEVVALEGMLDRPNWAAEHKLSRELLAEAGVNYRVVTFKGEGTDD